MNCEEFDNYESDLSYMRRMGDKWNLGYDLVRNHTWKDKNIFEMSKKEFLNLIKFCLDNQIILAEDALSLMIDRTLRDDY